MSGIESLASKLAANGLPALARQLLGPLGGAAVDTIAKTLGMADGTVEEVTKTLALDPDTLVKLKTLDREIEAQEIAARQAAQQPTFDALRVPAQAPKLSRMPSIVFLVLSAMVIAFGASVMTIGAQFTDAQWDQVKFFGPLIFASWGISVGYFVGSSSGSAQRAPTLDTIVQSSPPR